MARNSPPPVLIVGAGPTGLMLALWLARFNVPFRLVDQAERKPETSRALVVHARTLEFYRQLGIADEIIAAGRPIQTFRILHQGKLQNALSLAGGGKGISHFPFALCLPQDRHEELLEAALRRCGGAVERGVELVELSLGDDEHDAEAVLRHADGGREERFAAGFVAGCDGAHSAVRRASGLTMEGGTYDSSFFVADAVLKPGWLKDDGSISLCVSDKDICLIFPWPNFENRARIIGLVPSELEQVENVSFDDLRPVVTRNAKAEVESVNWFSRYRVHHRMASDFQKGRAFILGDAAHIHSPVGGQGMNTGLGDATNLAWKLAAIYGRAASLEIARTYAEERMPFARLLLNSTDYAFTLITNEAFSGRLMRNWVVPMLVPFAANWLKLQPQFFRRTSQTAIEYRESRLSRGAPPKGGMSASGDRLPLVEFDDGSDNHATLGTSGWQGHVYGAVSDEMLRQLAAQKLQPATFAWTKAAANQGLCQDALYLIRPDGHIGLMATEAEIAADSDLVGNYCSKWSVWSS